MGKGKVNRILGYNFMQNALFVSVFISILCPCIGIFLVLRHYSMIGDTLSHASLTGVTIGLTRGQNPVLGAFLLTSLCGALIEFLRSCFKKYTNLILAVVLFLNIGTVITIIGSGKLHANADSFLFGSILTITEFDVAMTLILSLISVLTLIVLYRQMIYIAYDEEAAKMAGVRIRLINYVFSILVVSAVSISIRVADVLVLSSMITLPVATALQLEKGFRCTFLFSIVFSFLDITLGLFPSYYLNVAPGGFTALVSVAMFVLVLAGKQIARRVRSFKGSPVS